MAKTLEEKRRRANLINRRSMAWIIEVTAVQTLVMPIIVVLFAEEGSGILKTGVVPVKWSLVLWGAYCLARDLLGSESVGKRLLGLTVMRADSDAHAPAGMRVGRNVTLIVPLVPVVEFLVAYFGNKQMQRLGDFAASTRVVDVQPGRFGRGTYSWSLVLTLITCGFVQQVLVPLIVVSMVG